MSGKLDTARIASAAKVIINMRVMKGERGVGKASGKKQAANQTSDLQFG